MRAYARSDLGGDVLKDSAVAVDAIHTDRPGTVLGILDSFLRGPYPVTHLTLAIRVCSCGQFIDAEPWIGEKAIEGEMFKITHGMCGYCLEEAASKHEEETSE